VLKHVVCLDRVAALVAEAVLSIWANASSKKATEWQL
jgi:hypothetical protein